MVCEYCAGAGFETLLVRKGSVKVFCEPCAGTGRQWYGSIPLGSVAAAESRAVSDGWLRHCWLPLRPEDVVRRPHAMATRGYAHFAAVVNGRLVPGADPETQIVVDGQSYALGSVRFSEAQAVPEVEVEHAAL